MEKWKNGKLDAFLIGKDEIRHLNEWIIFLLGNVPSAGQHYKAA